MLPLSPHHRPMRAALEGPGALLRRGACEPASGSPGIRECSSERAGSPRTAASRPDGRRSLCTTSRGCALAAEAKGSARSSAIPRAAAARGAARECAKHATRLSSRKMMTSSPRARPACAAKPAARRWHHPPCSAAKTAAMHRAPNLESRRERSRSSASRTLAQPWLGLQCKRAAAAASKQDTRRPHPTCVERRSARCAQRAARSAQHAARGLWSLASMDRPRRAAAAAAAARRPALTWRRPTRAAARGARRRSRAAGRWPPAPRRGRRRAAAAAAPRRRPRAPASCADGQPQHARISGKSARPRAWRRAGEEEGDALREGRRAACLSMLRSRSLGTSFGAGPRRGGRRPTHSLTCASCAMARRTSCCAEATCRRRRVARASA
eukprot:scaffold1581_cov342-Prasinococcus_capsulatus_cf.AAC.7